jgi:polyisoprenoid-binding protein YceI
MPLAAGTYKLGPENGSLMVKTYREGVAAKVGHDLVFEVTRWEATVEIGDSSTIELSADPHSLEVREALRGLKPLTDHDRSEIAKNIDEKVLRGRPISFRSTAVDAADGRVEGQLTLAGSARPISAQVDSAEGRVSATIPLTQSAWGIKPYRGLMGALKVRDELEIVIDARAPKE